MRVIAGKLRGAVLQAPPGTDTRPITDRVKESLFNILGHRFGRPGFLPDIEVLDLFAGSGSLGVESLSRGARSCVFVERDRRALRVLRANIDRLGLSEVAQILTDNAWTMRIPHGTAEGYGLIFVDPPYRDASDPLRLLPLLQRLAPRLSQDGLLVLRQSASATPVTGELHSLSIADERTFGRMRVLLLAPSIPAPENGEEDAEG
jgi:16S rRNA (guanine966-N2)-methyltransferase